MGSYTRTNLLSSQARVQVPWIKVVIGDYTFGVYSKVTKEINKNNQGFYTACGVHYPNYIQSLNIKKINGQVNEYTLAIAYPVTTDSDPNFFEKVFSSISNTRKIIFSYGDASMPTYCYKDEEAVITKVSTGFNFGSGGTMGAVINYTINAVSVASLTTSGSFTFTQTTAKPSDEIKKLFRYSKYNLTSIFKGMTLANLDTLIAGDDKTVTISGKRNISVLDYLSYLVSCMIPEGSDKNNISKDIYILTMHDDTVYDDSYNEAELGGAKGSYFKVTKVSYNTEHADAFVIDIGYNTSTIVTNFSITDNENYSILYDYQTKVNADNFVNRLNNKGEWEYVFAPNVTSNNDENITRPEDITWWTKITKYPIKANLTVQGLLRPAQLMTYVRLNVIFPSGHKHIASGLYIITDQTDSIDGSGYRTTLGLTRISGDIDTPIA